jgi:hypothetical protein
MHRLETGLPVLLRSLLALPTSGLGALLLCLGTSHAGEDSSLVHPDSPVSHPCLLLNSNGVAGLKQRIVAAPWAKASWAELETAAERDLNRPLDLPPRGGNWSHNYVCPTHGARLNQGKQIGPWQWEHVCPVGHHVLRGDPTRASLDFDGNSISGVHAGYAQQLINDGLVYQVKGDAHYARKGREILLAYAERYLSYPLHDNQGRRGSGGRVASQSLTEASWLIDMAQGADLIWNTLSNADRRSVAEKLLRPALEQVIIPRRLGIHNIQCRHNSAIGLTGFLLGDQHLISLAIDDPAVGFRRQLEKGVLEDGMWLEGSSGYHFFTIAGLWPLAEAARNCGLELYTEKFQKMFEGPLSLAMPNFVLPDFNDSGMVLLQNQADLYELAYARFHNSAYASLLSGTERGGRLALLFGVTSLPSAKPPAGASASRNSPGSGYAMLQRGEGKDATWLCVKYGPHGGGHGHPDKNTFILYARGRVVATDAGTHAYGSPLHRDWDKTTLAHNTLVVDEASQEPATGKCLAFGAEKDVDYSITDAGPIYKGVTFTRTVALLTPELVLFVDQIQADAAHTFDLAYHQIGKWETNGGSSVTNYRPSAAPGYTHLTQTVASTSNSNSVTLKTELGADLHPSITLLTREPTEVITGYGILKTTTDLVPILLQHRHSRSTAFIWAISLDGAPVTLRNLPVTENSGEPLSPAEATTVQVTGRDRQWNISINPERRRVSTVFADGSTWRTESPFAVRE